MASAASSSVPSPSSSRADSPLLARLGLLSDIQYADVPDGANFLKTEVRYYRHSLQATSRAIARMNGRGAGDDDRTRSEWRCQAVLHLGDLIDGFNATAAAEPMGDAAVESVMSVLPSLGTDRIIPPLTATQSDTNSSVASSAPLSDDLCCKLCASWQLLTGTVDG